MDLDSVAGELYGLPLGEFVSTRMAREKQARAEKDKELAGEIHRLVKPNLVAWLVNQLVRRHDGDIQTLVGLGSEMREATANPSGDRLRELSLRQHRLTRSLENQAEQLLSAEAGRNMSDEMTRSLEETLLAALADPKASDALAAGRLTTGLRATGFSGLVDTGDRAGSVKGPSRGQLPTRPKSSSKADIRSRTKGQPPLEQRTRVAEKISRAKSAADEAAKARLSAHGELRKAERKVADATANVGTARKELQATVAVQSQAESARQRAQIALQHSERRLRRAERELAEGS